jgi:hypothetical protein
VIKRRYIEEIVLFIGMVGLLLIFQPFSLLGYTIGWILMLSSTLIFVIFTLIPENIDVNNGLLKYFIKTLIIVVLIIIAFITISIWLTPRLIG